MQIPDYLKELDAAVTICDRDGIIIYMNEASAKVNAKSGGIALLGKNLYDCHPPAACEKIRELLAQGETNAYTIEKNGMRKMIWQGPWRENGEVAGLVEISMVLPMNLPHYVRK